MKEPVSHQAPKVMYVQSPVQHCFLLTVMNNLRKKLQFSLLNAQDTVKISEFEVTHRDLYTVTDRLPVKDGVLDRRLVRYAIVPYHEPLTLPYRVRQRKVHFAKPVDSLL
jgi:hypothetical protein